MKRIVSMLLALALMIGLSATASVSAGSDEQGGDTFRYNGHVYQIFDVNINCIVARRLCEKRGGYLASVTDYSEQKFLADLLESTTSKESDYFIGGTDAEAEGVWRWMNGEEWSFTAWYPGGAIGSQEPNNGLGAGEDYLIMNRERGWQWVDVYGGYDHYTAQGGYICEWDSVEAYNAYSGDEPIVGCFWYTDDGKNQIEIGETKEFFVYNETGLVTSEIGEFRGRATWRSSDSETIAIVGFDKISSRVKLKALQSGASNISLLLNDTEIYTFRVCTPDFAAGDMLCGDVDGDDEITILDATCIQRKLASIATAKFVEEAADADEDGELSILDATAIQRWLAQLPSNDNIGKPIA